MILQAKKILVVIPHEDDEINLAGATIYQAKKEGKQVICVFATNGDWLYPVEVRMREALRSLTILGVPAEDVVFLGYPDGGTHAERSIFMHGKGKVLNVNGRTHTYGSTVKKDFASTEYGKAQPYTWSSLLDDLKRVILKYYPDMIIGTDFDNHPDHRMCSIALDTVMGEILNCKGNDYFPMYLKGFAYSMAFEGVDDFFSSSHLLSSKPNPRALTYPEFGTDNPAFEWDKRIRFPVHEDCCTLDLDKNVIYKALCSYVSQRIFVRAGRIINGDQVFWEKRTDNLAYQGQITVSSGKADYLHDFQTMYASDISVPKPKFDHYCWVPDKDDHEKWCRCTFEHSRHIEKISLWGNIEEDNQVLEGELLFSNGYRCKVPTLRRYGRETEIAITPQDEIMWVEFHITRTKGNAAGLAEWGIYGYKEQWVEQDMQICCNDEFAYQWYCWPREKFPELKVYPRGLSGDIKWSIDGELIDIKQIKSCRGSFERETIVHAEVTKDFSSQVAMKVFSGSMLNYISLKCRQIMGRWRIHWRRLRIEGKHHKMKKEAQKRVMQS